MHSPDLRKFAPLILAAPAVACSGEWATAAILGGIFMIAMIGVIAQIAGPHAHIGDSGNPWKRRITK